MGHADGFRTASGSHHPVQGRAAHRLVRALRDEQLPAVVRALELLIESGTRPWFVLGACEQIEAILGTALAADGEPAARARDVVPPPHAIRGEELWTPVRTQTLSHAVRSLA
jgi:hypothetical protein